MEASHQAALSGLEQLCVIIPIFPINPYENKVLGSYLCIEAVAIFFSHSSFILVTFFLNKAFWALKILLCGDMCLPLLMSANFIWLCLFPSFILVKV